MAQSPAQLANLNRNGRKPGSRNLRSAVAERVRKSASAGTTAAMRALRQIVADDEAGDADRIRAAQVLLAYAVGKPGNAPADGHDRNAARELTLEILMGGRTP